MTTIEEINDRSALPKHVSFCVKGRGVYNGREFKLMVGTEYFTALERVIKGIQAIAFVLITSGIALLFPFVYALGKEAFGGHKTHVFLLYSSPHHSDHKKDCGKTDVPEGKRDGKINSKQTTPSTSPVKILRKLDHKEVKSQQQTMSSPLGSPQNTPKLRVRKVDQTDDEDDLTGSMVDDFVTVRPKGKPVESKS